MSRFKNGEPSPNPQGRKPGSRNKLTGDFVRALSEDFAEHGIAAIRVCRMEKPDVYLKCIASLVPREMIVSDGALAEMSDDEIAQAIHSIRALRQSAIDGIATELPALELVGANKRDED